MPRTFGNTKTLLPKALLARTLKQMRALDAGMPELTGASHPEPSRLRPLTDFGSNPGGLRMHAYVPPELAPRPALVVVLHGCTQTAAGYDLGAGWSTLADRFGFVLLFPEQTRENNPKGCFNWFLPRHIARDRGEALSIRQGVERAVLAHGIDREKVFVTGLSAGGAMAGVMLATYPEIFAGGAIIAGLPYGCASNVQGALQAMYKGEATTPRILGERVRAASRHRGPWPTVSVWHGSADTTVVPANADQIVDQWLDVHGLIDASPAVDRVDGFPRRAWRDSDGRAVVEAVTITGMGHGTPLAPRAGSEPHGRAGPFLLDVGIASSLHIARGWGLTDWRSSVVATEARSEPRHEVVEDAPAGASAMGVLDVERVIADALRSAGLMKR